MKATVEAAPNVVVRIRNRPYVRVLSQGGCTGCAFYAAEGGYPAPCGVMPCRSYVGPDERDFDWIFVEVK